VCFRPSVSGLPPSPLGRFLPLSLRPVLRSGRQSFVHPSQVQGPSDHFVLNPWQVSDSSPSNQDRRVLVQPVSSFSRNVGPDFLPRHSSHRGHPSLCRVRLLRGFLVDFPTHPSLLWGSRQPRLSGFSLRRHSFFSYPLSSGRHFAFPFPVSDSSPSVIGFSPS
jgi:hypothetical protein